MLMMNEATLILKYLQKRLCKILDIVVPRPQLVMAR